jgi:hypothetical protein
LQSDKIIVPNPGTIPDARPNDSNTDWAVEKLYLKALFGFPGPARAAGIARAASVAGELCDTFGASEY